MALSVLVSVPFRLAGMEKFIGEGWDAFFEDKERKDCPYVQGTLAWEAWRHGYLEAMDYGN